MINDSWDRVVVLLMRGLGPRRAVRLCTTVGTMFAVGLPLLSGVVAAPSDASAQGLSTVVLSTPHTLDGLFTAGDGTLYGAGAYNSDELVRIDPDGTVTVVARGLGGPIHGAEDSRGRLWVSNFSDGTVSRVDPATGATTIVARGLDGPSGVAIDDDDRVYVADWGARGAGGTTIHRILPDGSLEVFVSGNGLDTPIGLALDGKGGLYVANARDGRIHRIDLADRSVSVLATAPLSPRPPQPALGHMVYRDGRLYVSGNFRHVVYVVEVATGAVSILAGLDAQAGKDDGPVESARMTIPNGLALSPDGRTIWIAEGGAALDTAIRRLDLGATHLR